MRQDTEGQEMESEAGYLESFIMSQVRAGNEVAAAISAHSSLAFHLATRVDLAHQERLCAGQSRVRFRDPT